MLENFQSTCIVLHYIHTDTNPETLFDWKRTTPSNRVEPRVQIQASPQMVQLNNRTFVQSGQMHHVAGGISVLHAKQNGTKRFNLSWSGAAQPTLIPVRKRSQMVGNNCCRTTEQGCKNPAAPHIVYLFPRVTLVSHGGRQHLAPWF